MSEADNLTNLAFPERLDSVNSTAADQANTYPSDSPDETLAPSFCQRLKKPAVH